MTPTIEHLIAQIDALEVNTPRAFILADAAGMLLAYAAIFAERDMPVSAASAKRMADRPGDLRRELLGVRHDHD